MTSTRTFLTAAALLLSTACAPPTPTLARLSTPVITAQRRLGGPLQVILTYDTSRTACGEVPNLRATLDGNAVNASAGSLVPEAKTEADRCLFPGFLITPEIKNTPREIVFTDDVTTFNLTVNTLNLGSAVPDAPPATFRPGTQLRWLASPPSEGTSSWKVAYTPTGGAEVSWGEGANLPDSVSVTVPATTVASSGIVALSWLVNTTVSKCEGLDSCAVTVQGNAPLNAVVVP
jgi:hypothetical protein